MKKLFSFRMERPKHKTKVDFNDVETLYCNRFSPTEKIDTAASEKKTKKVPDVLATSDTEERLPF